ncbi:putative serine--tRNA ligase [Saccharomycopsis crataegensis]|uniref:serine--tRNA ligase n=1 Tax=Saccharomycopsis crataegensis TaxID=43959 RepID=A0AAV5QLJ9_9ASCO|nr:putative serine--tRNA ligase [Saccharomycopsis crataegensis]
MFASIPSSLVANSASRNYSVLAPPAYNLKHIIANLPQYADAVKRREVANHPDLSASSLQKLPIHYENYMFYTEHKKLLVELRNRLQDLYKRHGKSPALKQFLEDHPDIISLKDIKTQLKQVEDKLNSQKVPLFKVCSALPNLIDESALDSEFQVVEYINYPEQQSNAKTIDEKASFLEQALTQQDKFDHKTIVEKFGIVDFSTASKISGNSWYYLINDGALLEQALVQYALKEARKAGFTMCIPPSIVKDEISNACGFQPRDLNNEKQTYELSESNLVLTGTAEIPLAGLSMNKLFQYKELPQRLVGVSRSYRAEAGARGKDTKGLYRVHEFTKVELFTTCAGQGSKEEFSKIVEFQKSLIGKLGLLARVINIPANDLGAPAYQKYDIEAWMPGRGSWGELTSTSICTDFQSRRFHTKYVDQQNKRQFAHTLNGTAMAVPRVIVAIIENNYDPENDCIWVPEVLRPYMDDKEMISL